ncbi:CLUMA_CG005010, isoform A [Clunio marinus]|uniref:CLUMA_CG005010, isoform A n=1 Tax=Clunio marinus TaxID=568069 RepID=A0A1J1HTD8_9DIPT|nr:CLUMA_CG005010, isoform A [Clunio marinus]
MSQVTLAMVSYEPNTTNNNITDFNAFIRKPIEQHNRINIQMSNPCPEKAKDGMKITQSFLQCWKTLGKYFKDDFTNSN